jgi:glycosyltransferase involved in cell wall biosynthesis
MIKVAYYCEPQLGGTFTFFLRLRPALLQHGIDMQCISPLAPEKLTGGRFEGIEGLLCVGQPGPSVYDMGDRPDIAWLKTETGRMIEYLSDNHFDMIMILPAADMLSSNLPTYLSRSIRATIRVPMMTRGAYAPTSAIYPHVNKIFAVSDRIADDLNGRYGVQRQDIEVIYHGVEPEPFEGALADKAQSGPLNLLYAGRLWDIDKGIFILPEMMKQLKERGQEVHLTVAGDGPDAGELRRRFERAGVMGRVTMTGGLKLADVHEQFRRADVFVFPSRFEGCGFAVLEAMAAGCAPVVSDIRGSLRVIVDDGQAGGLARVGDARAFAEIIGTWAKDRGALREVQKKARQRYESRFTLNHAAKSYAASIAGIMAGPDHRVPVRPLSAYEVPRAFKPTWRTLIPAPVKNVTRMWLERLGISS